MSFQRFRIVLLTLSILILSNFGSAQADFSIEGELLYEQFDTEILVYAKMTNNSSKEEPINLHLRLIAKDFSNNIIQQTRTTSLELLGDQKKSINLITLEYSVLSQAVLLLTYQFSEEQIGRDTLDFNFPNAFANVNSNGGPRDVEIDLGGLKIDQTRTPFGREFFEMFEQRWVSPNGISDYTIKFEEIPFRFRSTILRIFLDNEMVFESLIRDNDEFLEQLLNYVIVIVQQKLVERHQSEEEFGGNDNGI